MDVSIIHSKNLPKQQDVPSTQYIVVQEDFYHPDLGKYCTYGIQVENEDHTVIIHDISTCWQAVIHMVGLFNRCKLSPVHLFDVVEDMFL